MSTLEVVQSMLPLISQRRVKKLAASLKRRNLLIVIDEVLSHATFRFDQSSLCGSKALRVSIGSRNQSDGIAVAVWAYISDDRTGSELPIVFRDEVPTASNGGTTTRLYPRAASSLLRKARQLRPPFCFLQQELDEGVKDGRGMICAVVAYYALITGSSDCAVRWPRFDACLIAALDYINTVVGVPAAKQAVQQDTALEMTGPTTSMASPVAASKAKFLNITAIVDRIPKVEGGVSQPMNFADTDQQHNKSLVVRFKLNRHVLAEITGFVLPVDFPKSQDEAIDFVANGCDSGLEDGVDSMIGDNLDIVIGGASDDVVVTMGRFDACDKDRRIYRATTSKKSKKRKLEQIAKCSDYEDFRETDGCEWRQASRGRRNRG
ncbi:hypothetical protein G6011_01136 [Alternaria panax]|uniref:Uncharacterized protein n=1 Tax=Alternaria panax TaxID=48097 RepID=A0AAD4NW84_9PLEO|nr:hypothetical protein G6011_01136 [Alternaria panax]